MSSTTKLYINTTDQDMDVIGVGIIPAGDRVSVSTEYQPPIIIANYPGLVDVTDTDITVKPDDTETFIPDVPVETATDVTNQPEGIQL